MEPRTSKHTIGQYKSKKISNTDPTKKPGVNSCACEGQAVPSPMLTVSLDCSFVIATYSLTFILTVNRHEHYICIGQYTPTEAWLIIDL
jgi:hypothetical protein